MKTLLLGDSILRFIPNVIVGNVENKSSVGRYTWMVQRDVLNYDIESYDKVFLLIGINDFLNRGYSAEKTGDCIIETINAIKLQNPRDLNVFGLLPVLDENLEESDYCNRNIPLINHIVQNYCEENGVKYIDSYSLFLNNNGKIDKALLRDGLHPSEKGYKVLTKVINDEIKRMSLLGESEMSE